MDALTGMAAAELAASSVKLPAAPGLVGLFGAKYRYSPEWTFGAALGLPGIPLHSAGTVSVQDVIADREGGIA